MMSYVIDLKRKFVVHQGNRASCETYIYNCAVLYGHSAYGYVIAIGAKNKNAALKTLKNEGCVYSTNANRILTDPI